MAKSTKSSPIKKKTRTKTQAKVSKKVLLLTPKKASFDKVQIFFKENFSLILIFSIIFLLGFLTGSLYKENRMLRNQYGNLGNQPAKEVTAGAGQTAPAPAGPNINYDVIPKVQASDHQSGNKNAKLTLIEYSDYECPYCNRFHPTMLQIMEKYGDKINWVYRHFPLDFHPNAQTLAEASECVAKYGSEDAYWQFSNTIFENMADKSIYSNVSTSTIDEATILGIAAQAGADQNSVKTCLDGGEMTEKVAEMQNAAIEAGISGTPITIIMKGSETDNIPGALPYDQVEAIIKKYL